MFFGSNIPVVSFTKLNYVGALLFNEYPSTLVYADDNNVPYVSEWVDIDEQTGDDKFYIYQSSLIELKRFITGKISHYDLIMRAESGVVAFYTGYLSPNSQFSFCGVGKIKAKYVPSPDFYFTEEDSPDLDQITNFFSLRSIEDQATDEEEVENERKDVTYYSEKTKSDLFRIHLKNGPNVGHGKVKTMVLGSFLLSFEGLYHEVVNDKVKGIGREQKISGKVARLDYENIANTEVVIQEAASFAVFIRPRSRSVGINFESSDGAPLLITDGEQVFKDLLQVISSSVNPNDVAQVQEKYSHLVFSRVKDLASQVKRHKLAVDLEYYSPITKHKFQGKIDQTIATQIIQTITNVSLRETEHFKLRGSFTVLNIKTGYFNFQSEDGEEYAGYFEDLVKEGIWTLNFKDSFEVTLERRYIKNITDEEYRHSDLIISYLKAGTQP